MRYAFLLPVLALSASAQLCANDPTICPPDTVCQDRGDGSPSCTGGVVACPYEGTDGGAANWGQLPAYHYRSAHRIDDRGADDVGYVHYYGCGDDVDGCEGVYGALGTV
ncbi:hypothetical protein V494_03859 [Pseudogymnoascus sp. VKM F-4513 (FW-928)]|nr:hypothetical protein V494_03859 [Pseudogymnoascus sp. VKM F-4513 (FW-928)]